MLQTSYESMHQVHQNYSGFTEEYAALLPLYRQRIKDATHAASIFPSAKKPTREFLGIDTVDLNDDGVDEIFVWFESPTECGPNLCELSIYQRDMKRQMKMIGRLVTHGGPSILKSKTQGYHDLAYLWWEADKEFYLIYRWNGAEYQRAESIMKQNKKYIGE